MSDFELMQQTLTKLGIVFALTDDSVIVIPADEDGDPKDIHFFFTRLGKYKELDIA